MRDLEEHYWKQIEELEWSKDHDYKRIEQYLKDNFTVVESIDLIEFINDKIHYLYSQFQDDWLGDPGIEVSDDGWSDLTAEVVGRGKKFYKNITVEKLQKMAIEEDYQENFTYSFQFTYKNQFYGN